MDIRLLGSFELHSDGSPVSLGGHRQRAVLAILALAPNEAVSAEVLVERLWSGSPPRGASGTLQAYVSNLRRVLEPERAPRAAASVLTSTSNGYRLVLPEAARDIDRFEADSGAARRAFGAGDPAAAVRLADRALAQWRGPALADFAAESFATADIMRLEEARLLTLELRAEAQLAAGDHAALVADLRSLTEAHPLRERLRGQLMLALYRCGRQAEALEVARVGRELLAEELGIDPGPAIRALEQAILRQDPELEPPDRKVTPASIGVNSPPGAVGTLGGAVDGQLVGRTEESEVLDRALAAVSSGVGRVVLIGGEPGIGKSRLAEAFAREIHGASVVWGRCQELGAAPPFWPWRQVLRALAHQLDTSQLRAALGADAGVVLEVAPELADLIDDAAPTRVPDADTARFRTGCSGSMWRRISSAGGIMATVSISGCNTRSGSISRLPSSASPRKTTSTRANARPRNGSGTSGIGGSCRTRATLVIISGKPSVSCCQVCMISAARSIGQNIAPANTSVIGNRSSSMSVTMPKLPPPPRKAQNSSGS
jgi:DNA-binding SARP family transcriptional activator